MMEENKPFQIVNGDGVRVVCDGGCGFEIRVYKDEDREYPCLTVLPLKYRQQPGTRNDDNEILHDKGFVEFAFGSAKSVDVVIDALQILKEHCFEV